MRRFLLICLFLGACHGESASDAPQDASFNSVDAGDDAGDQPPTDKPPSNRDAGSDAGRMVPPPKTPDGSVPVEALGTDYRVKGAVSVTNTVKKFAGDTCSFDYESFTPATSGTEVSVVIAPGFAAFGVGSSREALRTLATYIASWGIATHTVSLCTNGGGINHPKNGAAIAEFGAKVGGKRVIYAGFSAGGLDALLAAAQATNVEAVLALDAVDSDLAKAALDTIKKPVYAMAGEPSMCNSQENMLAQYKGRMLRVLKVNNADHFTFEGTPCEGVECRICPKGGEPEAVAIRALAASFVVGITGLDANALSWWQEQSAGFTALSKNGVVSSIQ